MTYHSTSTPRPSRLNAQPRPSATYIHGSGLVETDLLSIVCRAVMLAEGREPGSAQRLSRVLPIQEKLRRVEQANWPEIARRLLNKRLVVER